MVCPLTIDVMSQVAPTTVAFCDPTRVSTNDNTSCAKDVRTSGNTHAGCSLHSKRHTKAEKRGRTRKNERQNLDRYGVEGGRHLKSQCTSTVCEICAPHQWKQNFSKSQPCGDFKFWDAHPSHEVIEFKIAFENVQNAIVSEKRLQITRVTKSFLTQNRPSWEFAVHEHVTDNIVSLTIVIV